MSPGIVKCPLGDHTPPTHTHTQRTAGLPASKTATATAGCFCLLVRGVDPACCHSGCLLQMACQRGEYICPRGPQGPVSAVFSLISPPLLVLPCLHTGPERFHPSPPPWLLACLSAAVSTAGQLWAKGKYLQLRGSRRTAQAHKRLG